MKVNVNEELFENITLFGEPMLFTCERCSRSSLPAGMYMYEIRHDDEGRGIPCEISPWIAVNHWGTVISNKPVEFNERSPNGSPYRIIEDEDWNYEGTDETLAEYMRNNPPEKVRASHDRER